jgi:peptidoglycan/LPS O-acetylase OafA/YrhL
MKRIPQLDGLRGIAVLMVFVYHAYHLPLMWAGVDLFFVLSGFLITGILLGLKEENGGSEYWTSFYLRRLLRIAPPYLGFLVVLSLMFSIPWHRLWYWYLFFAANIASALGKCRIDAMEPLWSLAVEEQFYFIWPCVVLLCSRRALKKVALAVMVGSPALRGIFTLFLTNRSLIYALMPFRADLLACGAFIALCMADDRNWLQRFHAHSLVSFVSATILLAALSVFRDFRLSANSEAFNIFGYSLIVVAFGSALVRVLGMNGGLGQRFLSSRALRFMGQISYTFYLYQVAILDKLGQYVHSRTEVVALGFVITAAFSAVSWRFFESRILKFRAQRPVELTKTGLA